jgi:hypothetical protein
LTSYGAPYFVIPARSIIATLGGCGLGIISIAGSSRGALKIQHTRRKDYEKGMMKDMNESKEQRDAPRWWWRRMWQLLFRGW